MFLLFPDFIPETVKQALFGALCFLFGFYGVSLVCFVEARLSRRRQRIITDEAFRKLDAKKLNEHLKLIGSFCNTLGAAVLGAAFIVPYIGNHASPDQVDLRWVFAGLALPLAGHIALRFMKSEG
ncbi:hypothetical protein ABZT49_12075 [Methylobacterium sp. EM32]|uniref:hypothetical protein n=1 Tax=Methylobacterium sp. EM32 TaxID=3163481 RepID=UPI0033BD2246